MADYSNFSENKLKTLTEEGDVVAAYTLANRYIQDGEQQEAFDYMLKAARGGVIEAMDCMGMYYAYGLGGVEQDLEKAEYWFMKGKDAGSESDYLEKLQDGTFFSTEEEVEEEDDEEEEDEDSRIENMKAAAEDGDIEAIHSLILEYHYSIKEGANDEALKYMEMGYALQDGKSADYLGGVYQYGECGKEEDIETAKEYYDKGTNWGYVPSFGHIATLLRSETKEVFGRNLEQDIKALHYSRLGAELGDPNSLLILGELYFWGRGGVERDVQKAKKCFARASEEGCSIYWLVDKGLCEELLGEFLEAEKTYKKAISYGDTIAYVYLARMYRERIYFFDKKSQAEALIQEAIKKDEGEAIAYYVSHLRNPSPSEYMPLLEKGAKLYHGGADCIALIGLLGDPSMKNHYYSLAYDGGSGLAAYFLGKEEEEEEVVNNYCGKLFMETAATNLRYPLPDAMFRLGKYALDSHHPEEAKYWFEMARDFGHPDAEKFVAQS